MAKLMQCLQTNGSLNLAQVHAENVIRLRMDLKQLESVLINCEVLSDEMIRVFRETGDRSIAVTSNEIPENVQHVKQQLDDIYTTPMTEVSKDEANALIDQLLLDIRARQLDDQAVPRDAAGLNASQQQNELMRRLRELRRP